MSAETLTAVFAGLAAVLSSYAAVVSAKRRGDTHCEERLAESRAESEKVADELHRRRMSPSE